jgi:hypothetical protein
MPNLPVLLPSITSILLTMAPQIAAISFVVVLADGLSDQISECQICAANFIPHTTMASSDPLATALLAVEFAWTLWGMIGRA